MNPAEELEVWQQKGVERLNAMCRLKVGSQVRGNEVKNKKYTDLFRGELRKSPFYHGYLTNVYIVAVLRMWIQKYLNVSKSAFLSSISKHRTSGFEDIAEQEN